MWGRGVVDCSEFGPGTRPGFGSTVVGEISFARTELLEKADDEMDAGGRGEIDLLRLYFGNPEKYVACGAW